MHHRIFDTPSQDFIDANESTAKELIASYKVVYEPLGDGTKLRKEVHATNARDPADVKHREGVIVDIKKSKKTWKYQCSFPPEPFSETERAEVTWCGINVTRKMADQYNEWLNTSAGGASQCAKPVHQILGEGTHCHSEPIKPYVTRVRRCVGGQYVESLLLKTIFSQVSHTLSNIVFFFLRCQHRRRLLTWIRLRHMSWFVSIYQMRNVLL